MLLLQAVLVVVRGAQHHQQPRVGQRVRHGHEVVLAAHAADHLAAFQRVAGRRAQQRHDHRGVHEARLAALRALQLGLAGQAP
jgi:DNA polymerase II large subunit